MMQLPAFISNNMVLQSGAPVPLWGWATPGDKIRAEFDGQTKSGIADDTGQWLVYLDPLPASVKPRTLRITIADSSPLTLRNVVVGEVWLCSGQSNMEWPLSLARDAEREIAAADFPTIRHFKVAKTPNVQPQSNTQGAWSVCSPASAGSFSAVAYFFARRLHKELGVPVGLLDSSWGGSCIEAWISEEAMARDTETKEIVANFRKNLANVDEAMADYRAKYASWVEHYMPKDPGNTGYARGWADPNFNANDWLSMDQPGMWQSRGLDFNGVLWFRKEIHLPAAWAGQELVLSLGRCDDFDTVYFNNTRIGGIGRERPDAWKLDRVYTVPGSLVRAGRNVITVRIYDQFGGGGFTGNAAIMHLNRADGDAAEGISLAGPWRYKIEHNFGIVVAPQEPQPPIGADNQNAPTALFNGMIAPLIPFAIRGTIWYQGESNARNAWVYRRLFPQLITDWRERWGSNFPFLFVQLPNHRPSLPEPAESQWAELRESQLLALNLPNTGMAITIDLGEAFDVHPRNKQDVGDRLALVALAQVYDRKDLVFSGPIFSRYQIEGSSIRVHFHHVAAGLIAKGERPTGFAVAGKDRKFVWADARIDGGTVLVSAKSIEKPVAVRYAWADNPVCNLYNSAGLPASPFRTDDWEATTRS